MLAKLYVGNLNFDTKEEDLKQLFGKYGEIKTADIIRDGYSGRSKGFGFVEMVNASDAEKALEQNGQEFMGRTLRVSEAKPAKRDGGGGDRGGRSGGGGGGRGRDNFRGGGGGGGRGRDNFRGGGGGGDRGGRW